MKAVCTNTDLSFALGLVSKAINPHNTLPVLNNILLRSEANKLYFAATNLEIAISYFIDAEVKNEGKVTIPAKLFSNYASLLEKGDVELNLEDGYNLAITSKHSQTKIKGISADEFPLIPKIDKGNSLELDKDEFAKSLSQVVFAASTNISRPVLTGVLFKVHKDSLTIVATDSYRLSEKKIKLDKKQDKDLVSIIPSKTIAELVKILYNIEGEKKVELNISKDQVLFKIGNLEMISRLIEGVFPDYEKVIPPKSETSMKIKVNDFITAVRQVSLFVMETNHSIKLSVTNDGRLALLTDETQLGEVKTEIEVMIEGKNNQIALNAQYLLEFLNNCLDDTVMLILDNKLAPALLRPINNESFLHIIMPLKL